MKGAAAGIVVVGLLTALWGLAVSLASAPTPGVDSGVAGGVVVRVLPGSPGWHDGIRAGQTVQDVTIEDGHGSWAIRTSDGVLVRTSSVSEHVAELRDSAPVAAGALLLAVFSLLLLKQQNLAAALGGLAIAVGSIPLVLQGQPVTSTVGGLLAPELIGAYLVVGLRQTRWRVLGPALAGLGVLWLASRLGPSQYFDEIEVGRSFLPASAALSLGVVEIHWRSTWDALRGSGFPTRVDVALVTASLAAAAILFVVGAPSPVLAAALVVGAYVYPRCRRTVVDLADRIVFADVRERSGIAATEAERQRLASDIHDSPLQELAGVIKRLERHPEVGAEVDALVDIAGGLRRLSSELRPPAIDDLGLGPALLELAGVDVDQVGITVDLDDQTGFGRGSRLPSEVEVAAYRVAVEAIRNARHHAEASCITVCGTIGSERVELVIADDGRGIDRLELHAAEREGHFGIATMRQRAAMVGGIVQVSSGAVGSGGGGTSISFRWPA